MNMLSRLMRCERAGSAVEFALVLPLLLIFLFGIIDGGRFLWEFNRAEKATQMGVRYAVVTDPALSGLSTFSFATSSSDLISAGSAVPAANFTSAVCTSSSCTCVSSTGGFCGTTSLNTTAFANIVNRMALMYPQIAQANVEVDYKNVGLGFSGDPDGPDVSPLVTVKLKSLTFHPITCLVFACSISMPDFSAALTAEDLSDNGQTPPIAN
jgi:Flp pilus assembly protein TadG